MHQVIQKRVSSQYYKLKWKKIWTYFKNWLIFMAFIFLNTINICSMKLLSILRGNSAIIVKWLKMVPRQTDIWLSELDLIKSVGFANYWARGWISSHFSSLKWFQDLDTNPLFCLFAYMFIYFVMVFLCIFLAFLELFFTQDWSRTHRNPPASFSRMLGLKANNLFYITQNDVFLSLTIL